MSIAEVNRTLTGILGKENVVTAQEDLICYSFDATAGLPEHLPDLLVTPTSTRAGGGNCEGGAAVQAAHLPPGLGDQPERGKRFR